MKENNVLIGITIDKFKGIAPANLLLVIRKMGVEFVEITKAVFDDLPSVLENLGTIQTGFHLPNQHDAGFDFSFHEREIEIERLIRLINQHHHQLNVKYCLSHPPENKSSSFTEKDMIRFLLENLKKLEPPIILENIQNWNQQKFEDFYHQAKELLGEKLIGQCFDAAHYFLQGEDPVAYLQETDGRIQFIHLSDCRTGYDAHLPFGLNGELPIDDILLILKKQNYRGIINLELLPRKLADIKPLVNSYLKVVRNFDRRKYLKTKFKLLVYVPFLLRTMKQAF